MGRQVMTVMSGERGVNMTRAESSGGGFVELCHHQVGNDCGSILDFKSSVFLLPFLLPKKLKNKQFFSSEMQGKMDQSSHLEG